MNQEILEIVVKSRPDQFVAGMQRASTSGEKFVAVMEQIGRTAQTVGGMVNKAMGYIQTAGRVTAAGGAGIAAGLTAATVKAAQFEVGLRNINTLIPQQDRNMGKMSSTILQMSTRFPQSAKTLSDGMYDIVSSGFEAAEATQVLTESAKAATAGLTQTSVAAGTITAILNAYGKDASEAADVSDILFQTVNKGVLTFEELAATTGEWVSMASSAGVAVDDAAAALATMTLMGMNAAEASTSLSRIMTEFISPGEKMTQVLAQMGYESGSMLIQSLGLEGAMRALAAETGNNAEAWSQLFPDIRGTRGAMALMNQEGEEWARVSSEITDVTQRNGAANAAFAEQSKSVSAQMQLLRNNLDALAITIGQTFLPAINFMLAPLIKFTELLNEIPTPVTKVLAVLSALGSAVMIAGGLFIAFRLKAMLWSLSLRVISGQVARLATMQGFQTMGTQINWVSAQLNQLARAGGPIGSVVELIKGLGTAMGFAGKGARFIPLMVRSLATLTLIAGGAAIAGLALADAWSNAEDRGREAGKAFADAFQVIDDASAKEKLAGINQELAKMREEGLRISTIGLGAFRADDYFGGNVLSDAIGVFRLGKDTIMGGTREEEARYKELKRQAELAKNAIQQSRETIARAFLEQENPQAGAFFRNASGAYKHLTDEQTKYGINAEREVRRIQKLADEAQVNLFPTIDPEQDWEGYKAEVDGMVTAVNELIDANDGASSNAVQLEQDMLKLGDSFENAKSKIEALGDVLENALDIDFGLEEALDNFNSSLNDTYKQIQDIKKAGTLEEAMDPASMHEDAIALRSSIRGIVQDAADVAIAWAKAQPNLSGAEFTNYLDTQADALEENLRSLGIGEEAIARYTGTFRDLANNRELEIAINSDQVVDATDDVNQLLAQLGLAPKEVETAMTVYKEGGEQALSDYLTSLGRTPAEINTAINLMYQKAYNDLQEWNKQLNLADRDIDTLLKITAEGDEAAVKAFLSEKGASENEIKAYLEIVTPGDQEAVLGIIESKLKALTDKEWSPQVGVVDNTLPKINEIHRRLDELDRRRVNVQIQMDNILGVGGSNVGIGVRKNADGSYENHYAQIARGGEWRVWAEPETGGEAYIPLAAAKRKRSMEILQQVAAHFGVKALMFADGGIDFSKRVRSDSSGGGGDAAAKAAADAADDAWRKVQNMYRTGNMGRDEYLMVLQARLDGLEQFSDDWTSTWEEIRDVEKETMDEDKEKWDYIWSVAKNMFEVGDMSDTEMRQILNDKLNQFTKYSAEWMEAYNMLKDLDAKAKRQQEEADNKEDQKMRLALRKKQITEGQYLDFLRQRLARTEQYSDEWYEIQNDILDREEEIIERTKQNARNQEDFAFEAGASAVATYVQVLRRRLAEAEVYSDEYFSLLKKIEEVSGAGAVRSFGSLASSPFMNAETVSESSVIRYFQKKAAKAQEWVTIIKGLQASGRVSPYILNDLIQGGPDSLPLARTLGRMVQSGSIDQLNGSFRQIANSATFMQTPGTYASRGADLAAMQAALNSSVGATIEKLVNIEQMVVRNDSDIKAISDQLGFQTRIMM